MAQVIEVLVDGGKASAGPPLGPALGPLGVNVMKVVQAINEKTRDFSGMKVPIKLTVDPKTKDFEITVGTPPTSALLISELGIAKGSGDMKNVKVGNLTIPQAIKVARMKQDALLGATLKKKVKEVLGTCVSMGITVEGQDPRVVQKAIEAGEYDAIFNKEK
ncbi:MAG TPA: 50S ribosomal protein L11 [Candidatus Thermoplasmatota archaeon]|nr:50S ribosomal protein L11 [Candidatus Thermoplasmatota archaeon]